VVSNSGLNAWQQRLAPLIAGVDEFVLGRTSDPGSAAALDLLEAYLLDSTPVGTVPGSGIADAAVGYLGESLLAIGGGAWKWDETVDRPVVRLDPTLHRVIDPAQLIMETVTVRTGSVWSSLLAVITNDVDRRRQQDPDWQPARADQPVIGKPADIEPDDPWLTTWLAERQERFTDWVMLTDEPAEAWDFGPGSLDLLERVIRIRIPGPRALGREQYDEFREGAIWYLGEIARRHRGARWHYTPLDPRATSGANSRQNPYAGDPYVAQDAVDGHPDGNIAMPLLELEVVLETEEAGVLRDRFADFDR
jgi:hypothetical protein